MAAVRFESEREGLLVYFVKQTLIILSLVVKRSVYLAVVSIRTIKFTVRHGLDDFVCKQRRLICLSIEPVDMTRQPFIKLPLISWQNIQDILTTTDMPFCWYKKRWIFSVISCTNTWNRWPPETSCLKQLGVMLLWIDWYVVLCELLTTCICMQ